MPPYLQHDKLILWMTLAWLSIKLGKTDITKYGTRLRPLHATIITLPPSICATCSNKTSPVHRTKSGTKLQTNIKQESTDAKGTARESSNANLRSFYHTVKPLAKTQQTTSTSYSETSQGNSKRGATFFFTQVEPHRFEYRAMFQHHKHTPSDVFQPFVHDFDAFSKEFPPLPKFPVFPDFFPEHKDPFPNFNEFSFPTLPPSIKRVWHTPNEVNLPQPVLEEKFEGPLIRNYDVVLGQTRYPKIFRFNEERVNIEEFDRQKKLRFYGLNEKEQNELLEPESVKRDHLLILHGGVFTVQEPPLFNKQKHIKKQRKFHSFRSYIP